MSGSGVRNLTAKAFLLHTEQVSNAELWISLTISNLLIQLTESQRQLFDQCMLHAANSKHPQLSIFEHTRVPTPEDDFQKFYVCPKVNVLVVENMGILLVIARKHTIMLTLLKKVSKMAIRNPCWI